MVLPSSLKNNESVIRDPALEEERRQVGFLLKTAREEKNLSFEDVVCAIRIRKLYLIALEKGDLKALPGRAYVVGFIRSYASYLQLDGNELLRRLNLLVSVPPKPVSVPFRINVNNQIKPSYSLVFFFTFLGILVLGAFLWYKFSSEPALLTDSPTTQNEKRILGDFQGPSTFETGEIRVGAQPPLLPESVVGEGEKFTALTTPTEESGTERQNLIEDYASLGSHQKEDKQKTTDSLQLTEQTLSSQDFMSPLSENIEIQALEETWVQVISDTGNVLYMRVMKPGDSYKIPANAKAILNTGNAGGVRLLIGNDLFSSLGDKGEVLKGLPLYPQSLRKFYEKKSSYP